MNQKNEGLRCWTHGTDPGSATPAEEARRIAAEVVGEEHMELDPMKPVSDSEVIEVFDEDSGSLISKTAGEWAAAGAGLICSTEL